MRDTYLIVLISLCLTQLGTARPLPSAAQPASQQPDGRHRRSLSQVFTDSPYIPGTSILRTGRYSRLSSGVAGALQASDVKAAARYGGDTSLLVNAAATYTAGRTSRSVRADQADEDVQSAIRSGSASRAAYGASGATALWSAAGGGLKNDVGTRAEMAGEATAAAIRASLDNPNDAFRATATGDVQASSVSWPSSFATWT